MPGITAFMQRRAPKEIRFHHLAEEIHRNLFHRPSATDTSIVHENVDVAAVCKSFADCITYGSVIVHVERSHLYRQLLFRQDLPEVAGSVQVPHRCDYGVTAARQCDGGSQPDPATCPRN
jgi:hypothetical protein